MSGVRISLPRPFSWFSADRTSGRFFRFWGWFWGGIGPFAVPERILCFRISLCVSDDLPTNSPASRGRRLFDWRSKSRGNTQKIRPLDFWNWKTRFSACGKICCNIFIINPLIKKPTRVEVGSFSCNNPTIFKVKLWRKWPFFRFFRNFRKMVVFPLGKQPTSCRLSLIPCNRQTVGYSKPRVFIPIF